MLKNSQIEPCMERQWQWPLAYATEDEEEEAISSELVSYLRDWRSNALDPKVICDAKALRFHYRRFKFLSFFFFAEVNPQNKYSVG